MENWAVIINIKSGKKNFKTQINYLYRKLKEHSIAYELRITRFPGHAALITKHLINLGYTRFLIVGGDGTLNEFINGVFASPPRQKIVFGLIPRGTGNDWARYWGLSKNYIHSIDQFLEGHTKSIDIGKVDYSLEGENKTKYFINSVGFGLDAEVVRQTDKIKKYLGSHSLNYTLALILVIFKFKPFQVEIKYGKQQVKDLLFTMNVANACYSGGGMKQNPDAKPDDGEFDAMRARKPSLKDILTALPLIFNGKILQHRVIESFRADKIILKSPQLNGIFETDGILEYCNSPVEISVLPEAIHMIVPKEFK